MPTKQLAIVPPPAICPSAICAPELTIMSVTEWFAVADNPRQRNTVRHLKTSNHLYSLNKSHLLVFAARLPDGMLVKVDGHTRALLWSLMPQKAPPEITVMVYNVASMKEAEELYSYHDNKAAVDDTKDDMSGAFRLADFKPVSPLLSAYRGSTAMKRSSLIMMGYGPSEGREIISIFDAVPLWLSELQKLDQMDAPRGLKQSHLIAFLLTVRRRGTLAADAWRRFFGNEGIKYNKEMDGVQALHELHEKGGGSTREEVYKIAGKAIQCIECSIDNKFVGRIPKSISLVGYCSKMPKEQKKFLVVKDRLQEEKVKMQEPNQDVRRLILRST